MTATLTHFTFGGARPKPASAATSWLAKLLFVLAAGSEIFAEAQEEARKAHERYPFIVEW